MAGYIPFRLTLLLVSGFWLAGCIPYTAHRDDPYFAGYHRADPSQSVTVAITDRKVPLQSEPSIESQTEPTPLEAAEAPEDRDYTYQDWYRNRYRNEDTFQLNLSYHLYGPYYYRDFRSRYWLQYQRRWPWYAGGWYDDLWWDYPYGGYGLDRWYDPWYGYYDPWYGYYDPWYYGYPYSYYGGYGRYGGYGWYSGRPWYGTYATGSVQTKATERRPRNRRDLPTIPLRTADPLTGLGPESGISTTKTAAAQSRQSQSESSGTVSGRQARPSSRQGSYTTTGTSSRSSSSRSSTTRSTSSSSGGQSKSTSSARPRGRKP